MVTKSKIIKDFMHKQYNTPIHQEVDTTLLQLYSVIIFMDNLGYKPVGYEDGVVFGLQGFVQVKYKGINTREKFISFPDACVLHNGVAHRVVGECIDFLCNKHLINTAKTILKNLYDSRVFTKVYLQRTKNGVKVQQNQVEFNI